MHSPDRACSVPPRPMYSRESSSSAELFSDGSIFDDTSEFQLPTSRVTCPTSALGAFTCLPTGDHTLRELKERPSVHSLMSDCPLPAPQHSLPASCEKPPLKPIRLPRHPLDLESEARTPSNLGRRTTTVHTVSSGPIVSSDDGSPTSPSDQSMHSDSESNAASSTVLGELFLPPTGAEGLCSSLHFADDFGIQANREGTKNASISADRPPSTLDDKSHLCRSALGSTTESDDGHLEEDLENHHPVFANEQMGPRTYLEKSENGQPSGLQRAAAKNWSAWLRASISRAARRKTLTAGTSLFNLSPNQGIDYLVRAGVISNNPGAIAQFLTGSDLSCQAIGEYFGRLSDPLAVKVTKEFISRMDFEGLELDQALRRMLYRIHPDGESQKIEFLLHNFKESYERQNSTKVAREFRDPETIYTLVYAIVMLHTALYNPSVRRLAKPMTCEQFIANLRGVDAGDNLSEEMLRAIYNRVSGAEFKTVYDVMDRLHAVDQTLIGLAKPEAMLQRHRRFIGWTAGYEVLDVCGRRTIGSRPTSHLRGLFIFNDMVLVTKPVRSYGSHAVSELLGTNILDATLPRVGGATASDGRSSTNSITGTASTTLPSTQTHRRLRSLDLFIGGRTSLPPQAGGSEISASLAQQNEILRRNRIKVLPGVCSTAIPMNSQFQVRQVIPLLDIHVLVFGSGVYANGLELRDQEKGLIYLNLPTGEIRQKVISWVHESIEETSELFRMNVLKDNWLRPAETIPTF
nr:unnamed protein product [Spirometra erinaceieuropaei]